MYLYISCVTKISRDRELDSSIRVTSFYVFASSVTEILQLKSFKMLSQVLRPIVRNVAKAGTRSASSEVAIPKRPTINDIPVPHGSWKEHYDARQKVYNTQLIAGITILLGTLTFIKMSGVIFFNWGPPEEPTEEK